MKEELTIIERAVDSEQQHRVDVDMVWMGFITIRSIRSCLHLPKPRIQCCPGGEIVQCEILPLIPGNCHPCRPLGFAQPQFPPSATVYDYFVDPKKLDWEPWEPKVPPFRYLKTMPFHKMIVPTVDTVSLLVSTQQFFKVSCTHGQSMLVKDPGLPGIR